MEKTIRVAIAEDNASMSDLIVKCLERKSDVTVVGVAKNGAEMMDVVRASSPDAVITDIVMPGSDGFDLIEKLCQLERAPYVMVISAVGTDQLISRALEMGVRYYMIKPFDPETLYTRLLDMFRRRTVPVMNMINDNRTMDEQVTSVLLSIGIPAHIKGFAFIREAVRQVVADPSSINSITKKLYPAIADYFDTTPSKVERAIRHAIEVSWARGKIENINEIFGLNIYGKTEKPTNGEFIALIADHMLLSKSA